MTWAILVLADQLSSAHSALVFQEQRLGAAEARRQGRVVLVETLSGLETGPQHRQRLVLFWSSMAHFGEELAAEGWRVERLAAAGAPDALRRWCSEHVITELHGMAPADRPVRQAIERQVGECSSGAPSLTWHRSNAFLWSPEQFAHWAEGRRQLRMELFYREGRRRTGVLMEGSGQGATPIGGQWNYDHANRRPPGKGLQGPEPLWFEPDALTRETIARVRRLDGLRAERGLSPLRGALEPFGWPVNRRQALQVLEHFVATRLAGFGPYQDAMVSGQPTLWHSLLAPAINLGLLHPREVIERLASAGRSEADATGTAVPLASLEGVIRQVLGWREYTHALYHWLGPDYPARNHFQANRPLPRWLEDLDHSGMACMDTVLAELRSNGYVHHIQRLMVLANYGLLAGLDPQALTDWFARQFVDAHDWVMQTNVIGMGLHADGGVLASKPYAASGNYINRMSTYCKGCRHDVKRRHGTTACPFNSLYWDFLARHQERLQGNPRMGLVMQQLKRLPPEELSAIRAAAAAHLEDVRPAGGPSAEGPPARVTP
jgi:deoxyribodipyrimidine photolyase-related protein